MANLKTKILGRTGLAVTQLGYGSMGLRGRRTWGVRVVEEAEAERVLHAVLDAGINFIDTAPDYGISEERIGRYLGSRRGELFLRAGLRGLGIAHVLRGVRGGGLQFGEAVLLGEALRGRRWRIGGRHVAIPAPQRAIASDEPLAGLQ